MAAPLDNTPAEVRPHVLRPDLPWRVSTTTECGKQADEVQAVIKRAELDAMIKRDGQKRTAYGVCITCMETAKQWPAWDEDPVRALSREFRAWRTDPRMANELRALAALVEAHRTEFDDFVAGLAETVSLDEVRRARARRVIMP